MRFVRSIDAICLVIACALSPPNIGSAQPLLTIPGVAQGPTEEQAAKGGASATEEVVEKRAENAEQLRVAQRKLESTDPTNSEAAQGVAQEVALYQSIDAVLAQQVAVDQQKQVLVVRKRELETQLQTATTAEPATAQSFADLDRLRDELAAERGRATLAADKLAGAKAALEKAQHTLDENERKRRQAQESLETNKDESKAAELAVAAEQARQAAKLAKETVALRQKEVERERLSQEVQKLAVQLCQGQVDRLRPFVTFSQADYEAEIEAIEKKKESAHRLLLKAEAKLRAAEAELRDTQQRHDTETGDRTLLAEKLQAQRRDQEKLTAEIDSLTQRLQRLTEQRVAWDRRFQIASADRAQIDKQTWSEMKVWREETQSVLEQLAADLRRQILHMRELRSSLTSISKKAEAAKNGPAELMAWIDRQRTHVEAALRVHERNLGTIEDSRRVHEKLIDEIGRGVQNFSPTVIALGFWAQVERIWNAEIGTVDDISITVGKIIRGLLIFFAGWFVSRLLAAFFARRLLRRFRLSKDATAAIHTMVFYTLLAVAALMALRTVNVPLTAFTILGGALAIGVGFGSQALINNFIGGLIMLAERPVRLGERIKFGTFDGVVEDVGFRCTKLRTMTDHLVTIPNSTLVNDSIENAARRRTIRRLLNVTITYDTSREKIAAAVQAIRDILDEKDIREKIHPIVGFEEFPPRVHFNDFNAESLNIQVLYWYAPPDWWDYMEHCERVNFRIMEEFERLGVDFAFPSRTLYLAGDPQRDLAVRVLENGAEARRSVA